MLSRSLPPVASMLRPCATRLLALIAALLLPAAALAQVTYSGTTANQNFGPVMIGSTSAAKTFSFSVAAGTTVGSIAVLTKGAAGLDYASVAGGTCTATTYTAAVTCTVKAALTPRFAGSRLGAIVFYAGAGDTGTILGTALLYGIGTGPQIVYSPSVLTSVVPDNSQRINGDEAVEFDAAGNTYIADYEGTRILKVPVGGGPAIVFSLSIYPEMFVLDGAGDLYVVGSSINSYSPEALVKIQPDGSSAIVNVSANGLTVEESYCIAQDAVGDLFVCDEYNHRVVEVPADGSAAIAIAPVANGVALEYPFGLAVDPSGNLFIADTYKERVVEVKTDGTAIALDPTVNGLFLNSPLTLAVDAMGTLFINDQGNARIIEIPAAGGPVTSYIPKVPGRLLGPFRGMTFNDAGDLAVADPYLGGVDIIHRSQPPALTFLSATALGVNDIADGPQSAVIQNVGNAPLAFSEISSPADFVAAASYGDCIGSTILSPGAECSLAVNFHPESTGALSEEVLLTDNALSSSGGQQSIPVTGSGKIDHAATITSPAAGSTLAASTVTFAWTGGVGSQSYQLTVGTWGPGAGDIYNSFYIPGTSTSTVVKVPAGGTKIYVRLVQELNGVTQYADYTYTEAGSIAPAVISSPASGSTLKSVDNTFDWSGSKSAAEYELIAGTRGAGSSDIFNSGGITATSQTLYIPANGTTIYVQLWQLINSKWQVTNYTYTESGSPDPAVVISPSPGATLAGTSVEFVWFSGGGPIAYQFLVGTHGVGSGNLLNTYQTHATSATVTIPANGEKVWVRLNQEINGVWTSTDYIYTAAGSAVP